jgi:hypothetical protein
VRRDSVRWVGYGSLLTNMATEETSDLAELSLQELEDELATLASHIYASGSDPETKESLVRLETVTAAR